MGIKYQCDICKVVVEEADAYVLPEERRVENISCLCMDHKKQGPPGRPVGGCAEEVVNAYDPLRKDLLEEFKERDNALFQESLLNVAHTHDEYGAETK